MFLRDHDITDEVSPMKIRSFAAGAVALLMANAANATVYYDSTTVANPFAGGDGQDTGISLAANSFYAGTADFSQVSLMLSAADNTDTGSVMVYLVPDLGSPNFPLLAGLPDDAHAVLLGSIGDSILSSGGSLVTMNFSPVTAASLTTANHEYWIELRFSPDSSADWIYGDSPAGGFGMDNQGVINSGQLSNTGDVSFGTYGMIVDTPEPASLAILGGGLAGLGYFRRRSAAKKA
jgi:hypothetical protein